jgi:hypothetical protein
MEVYMPTAGISGWAAAFVAMLLRIVGFLPALLGAIIILLIGWGIGKLVQTLITRGLDAVHFNKVTEHAGINHALSNARIKASPAQILGVVAYWFVFLIAVQAAVSVLGIQALTNLMTAVLLYLPRIFGALLVVIAGAWAASLLGRLTRTSAETAGISYAPLLGNVVVGTVLFFTFAMALDILGISFPFLTTAFAIILGAFALAGAVAFGLGGREYATDILAGRQLRLLLAPGDRVTTDEVDGVIQTIGPAVTVVRTVRGDLAVENSVLMHRRFLRQTPGTGEGGMGQQAA